MSHEETVSLFLAACRQQLEVILEGADDPMMIARLTRELQRTQEELAVAVSANSSIPDTAGASV